MPNNDDIFAPPSKDELALFAPPSKEELAAAGGSNSPGLTEKLLSSITSPAVGKSLSGGLNSAVDSTGAALAGAAEGATSLVGGAARVGATGLSAADLAKQAAQGKVPDIMGTPAKWREYKKMIKDKQDEIANDSPIADAVGKGVGILAATPLIPELGGAKALSMAGDASPAVDQFLAGKAGGAMSKLAGKATGSAVEGAPLGAIMGGTNSDASNPEDFAKDVGSGVGMGSIGGAGLSLVGNVSADLVNAGSEGMNKWDLTRKLKSAYNMGQDGINFDTSAGKDVVAKQLQQMPDQITDQIRKVDGKLGQAVGDSLQKATDAGTTISIDPDLSKATDELYKTFVIENPQLLQVLDPKSRNLVSKLNNISGSDLSPIEANDLKQTLYDLSQKMAGLSSDAASIIRSKGMDVAGALNDAIKEQIPEYADAAQKFSDFRSKVPEVLLQPNLPADKRTKMLGDLKNKDTELFKGAQDVFGNSMLPGSGSLSSRNALNEVTGNLDKLSQSNPDAVTALGGSADDVGSKWKDMADKMAVLRQSQPGETLDKSISGAIMGKGESMMYNMANRVGRVIDAAGQSAPVQVASKVFNSGNDQLMSLASKMKTTPGMGFYGEALEKALNNKSDPAKNAVLFKMMQVPEYREMLRSQGYNDDKGTQ